MEHLLVIHYVLLVVMGWLILGVLGLISLRRTPLVAHMLFPAGAVFGILLFGLGLTGVFASSAGFSGAGVRTGAGCGATLACGALTGSTATGCIRR